MFRLKIQYHGKEIHSLDLEKGRQYTFGRGSNCDVVLEPEAGISRNHFRLFDEGGHWRVQSTSKFGDVLYGGQTTTAIDLEPGAKFQVTGYDFWFEQAENMARSQANESNVVYLQSANFQAASGDGVAPNQRSSNVPALLEPNSAPYRPPEIFEGSDEATRIVATTVGVPHIRMLEKDGTETTLKLEGRIWMAGREDGCDLLLNDRKASRRQFELTSSPQGFFIRDLGSSNGTTLNGMLLAHDELKPLRSGDVIRVGQVNLYFEIRDPNFEKRLMIVPQEVLSSTSGYESPYEMIQFPVPIGPGGAVRFDPNASPQMAPHGASSWIDFKNADAVKKKKIRFYAIGALIVILILYIGLGGSSTPPAPKDQSPFARLSLQKQKIVKETYISANNLVLTGKYDLAIGQLKIIHEIIPEGYEYSHKLEDQCKQFIESQMQAENLHKEQLRVQENVRRFSEIVKSCEIVARTAMSTDEVSSCLSPARDLDPANPVLDQMIMSVQQRVDAARAKRESQVEYQEHVEKGRGMYMHAQTLEANNQTLEALDAYTKHMNSHWPDPQNLKLKSKTKIIDINRKITMQVDEGITAAQAAYAQQNYREAIAQIRKVKAIDARNQKAAELNATVRRELNTKLKEMYEESVIEESLGQLERAKEQWKKINELDDPQGDYAPKATHKLKMYGSF